MKLKAYAKINLFLEIGNKRPDGYHDIDSVMQSVSLCDELEISVSPSELCRAALTECNAPELLRDSQNNLAVRAADGILHGENISAYAEIKLQKSIPIAAGLGGGSADAAAAMLGSCEIINADVKKYEKISAKLGADVPFCINGGCALSRGIGEVLSPLPSRELYVTIVLSGVKQSTKEQYRLLDIARSSSGHICRSSDDMVAAIRHGDASDIAAAMYNAFEEISDGGAQAKAKLIKCGALGALMSGSGPSVFGLFDSPEAAEYAARRLRADCYFAEAAAFSPRGVEMIEP